MLAAPRLVACWQGKEAVDRHQASVKLQRWWDVNGCRGIRVGLAVAKTATVATGDWSSSGAR